MDTKTKKTKNESRILFYFIICFGFGDRGGGALRACSPLFLFFQYV